MKKQWVLLVVLSVTMLFVSACQSTKESPSVLETSTPISEIATPPTSVAPTETTSVTETPSPVGATADVTLTSEAPVEEAQLIGTAVPITNTSEALETSVTMLDDTLGDIETKTPSTATPTLAGSDLALQIGFADEHVLLAGSQGFKLQTMRTSIIDEQPYIIFYLSRDYQPRVMNDFATGILVYEGDSEKIGSFVHRIEIREPINPEQNSTLPDPTGWSTSFDKVARAYEAAGFRWRASRHSIGVHNIQYDAVVVQLNDLHYALAFERPSLDEEPTLLEAFSFPELSPMGANFDDSSSFLFRVTRDIKGEPLNEEELSNIVSELNEGKLPTELREQFAVSWGQDLSSTAYVRVDQSEKQWTIIDGNPQYYIKREDMLYVYKFNYTFEEAWNAAQSDFTPESQIEKALYALGCNFTRGKENTLGMPGAFRGEQLYHDKAYLLYSCTLLTDYDPGPIGMDFQSNNFVAVFAFDGQNYKRLWNSLYLNTSTLSNWGDINGDQIPDLLVNKEQASTGSGATYRGSFEAGQDVFQLTSTGDFIDLLFGVDEAKLDVAAGYEINFSDLDGDGIAEIVANSVSFGLYGGKRIDMLYTIAPEKIYRLEDDFYYRPVGIEYGFLCQQAIDTFLTQESEGISMTDTFSAHTTLETCKAVDMQEAGCQAIKSKAESLAPKIASLPEGCRNWFSAVYEDLISSCSNEELPSNNEPAKDWDLLFDEAIKQGCN